MSLTLGVLNVIHAFNSSDDPGSKLPPGVPNQREYKGPWLQTQLVMASAIGIFSFLMFSYCRTRYPILFAPRTKLKGFSPHEAHLQTSFFSWIIPTIRTSEFTVLQTVGLDAVVLLNFFKMSFYLFTTASLLALCILIPANYYDHEDNEDDARFRYLFKDKEPSQPEKPPDWYDIINDANSIHTLHLLFTYAFTLLTIRFIYKNYQAFIRTRQLYGLQWVHSVVARTIMVTDLPNHLRGEHALAVHFENMELPVETVSLPRHLGSLQNLIDKRTEALYNLESAWTKYVGNPSTVESYDPSMNIRSDASVNTGEDEESQRAASRLVVPQKPRPTIQPTWFGKKKDALEHFEAKFQEADESVRRKRRNAKLKATTTAFVTFDTMSAAQVAAQVASDSGRKSLAPEPRDIVWYNISLTRWQLRVRELIVAGCMLLIFFFWLWPVSLLSTLLSYKEIQKVAPWLARLIDLNPTVKALVQNTLPSTALMLINGILPFILEALSYVEGHKARSLIEYSLLKKYFLFLLVNVVFIFLLVSTYWALVIDLANSPANVPGKLAQALRQGNAKGFFVSYVVLQALGVMPLQLLNLGVIIPRFFMMFFTRTPRDFAELNAPPMINYGAVYPQAILIFVITLLYSVIQPLILPFGAIYFGIAYVVYKYKLLFVFYKPYESRGQAWPITFNRLIWGLVIFQVFMIGVFSVSGSFVLTGVTVPLLVFTIYWAWNMDDEFSPLSDFVTLDAVFEAQRGELQEANRLHGTEHVNQSQTTLSRQRYAPNDGTLYLAPEDERTDYSQPPMANFYPGVLNTGKRRYGHPALNGVLPQPWLPLRKGQILANYNAADGDGIRGGGGERIPLRRGNSDDKARKQGVVLTFKRRASIMRKDVKNVANKDERTDKAAESPTALINIGDGTEDDDQNGEATEPQLRKTPSVGSNPWRDLGGTSRARARLSFDSTTGVIHLPDEDYGEEEDVGEDEEGDSDLDQYVDALSGDEGPAGANRTSAIGDVASDSEGTVPFPALPDSDGTSRLQRRRSTYWHHPGRKRLSSSFAPPPSTPQ